MTLRCAVLSGLVCGALGVPLSVGADPVTELGPQYHDNHGAPNRDDAEAVTRAFRSVLRRDPHPYEVRRYARLMDDYGWTEQDVRRDVAERSDYRRYSADSQLDTDEIVTRAYEDILGRRPDRSGLETYRRRIVREDWSEQDVRQDLRQGPEYGSAGRRTTSADSIIRRAYRDILGRDPDPSGLETYRRAILEDGWDTHDVRQALRASDEHRGQQSANRGGEEPRGQDYATQVVRNAYLAVLRREPDAIGLRDYGARVRQDHWSQADVERALRDSPEYRNRNR
jgi:hypothetical protein